VLAPLVVEIARDLDSSLSAVGVARSVLAASAVAVSVAIAPLIDRLGVRPMILAGAGLAILGAALTAAAPSLPLFYAAHAVTGGGVACLLSAGFAGVAAYFEEEQAAWAMGWVVGAQSIAWIAGNPVIGVLAEEGSWRLAYSVPAVMAGLALVAALGMPHGRMTTAAAERGSAGLAAVLRDRSARRWTVAELVAYAAWTAELTYAGAFYIESYGVEESTVGVLLAVGSVVFLVMSINTRRLTARLPRRPLIALAALLMGAMLVPILNLTPSVWFTVALFCVLATFAAIRSTAASALGLSQMPDRPGAMMGARTASAQLGYMLGAAAGAAVLAVTDFGTLGFVLFAGMAVSAVLIWRVTDPHAEPGRAMPEPVPD
jgi:predicted MFS family arabinose efflux permease